MSLQREKAEWELPHFRESHQMDMTGDFWSVKFYPYTTPGVDHVFAIAAGNRILVCRPPGKQNSKMEVLYLIVDEDADVDHYACVWSKDLEAGTPLLCVSGNPGRIKIIDALSGELLRTLSGHGGDVNDLVTSPVNPQILASASEDSTVRIWSLDPAHAKQPCAAILAGDGHKETILSLSFHSSGRYLLSAGVDRMINLWVLPLFPDNNTGTNTPTRLYYPHFSTSEIHVDIVDCVAWYDDLIFSKASGNREDCIVLWSINGFSPNSPTPPPTSAPTTHDPNRNTRSAFSPASSLPSSSPAYTRHLQLSIPDSDTMFMRFSLFPGSKTSNPMLAFCNGSSKVHFWDLKRFEEHYDVIDYLPGGTSKTKDAAGTTLDLPSSSNPRKHPFLQPFQRRNRGGAVARLTREVSPAESSSSIHTGSEIVADKDADPKGRVDWEKSRKTWMKKYHLGDPLVELEAHHVDTVKSLAFTGRQTAWSNDGQWCVVVGSGGVVSLFSRWK